MSKRKPVAAPSFAAGRGAQKLRTLPKHSAEPAARSVRRAHDVSVAPLLPGWLPATPVRLEWCLTRHLQLRRRSQQNPTTRHSDAFILGLAPSSPRCTASNRRYPIYVLNNMYIHDVVCRDQHVPQTAKPTNSANPALSSLYLETHPYSTPAAFILSKQLRYASWISGTS